MMKRIVFAVVMAAVLCSCSESLEERSAREAREFTANKCPARVNEYTIMDSLTFDAATHTVHYHYTLDGAADDASVVNRTGMYDLLLNEVRNSTSLRKYKEAGYTFAYTYRSASNPDVVLFSAFFTPPIIGNEE